MISRKFTEALDIPVAFGSPAGHVDVNYPLLRDDRVRLKVKQEQF